MPYGHIFPSLTKVIVLSLPNSCNFFFDFVYHDLHLMGNHPQYYNMRELCISHFVMSFENLLMYGQCFVLLFHTQDSQYCLQIPNKFGSVVTVTAQGFE